MRVSEGVAKKTATGNRWKDVFGQVKDFLSESLRVTDDKIVDRRRHRPDRLLFVLILTLLFVGLIVLWSIAPARAALSPNDDQAETQFIIKQLGVVMAGILAFFAAAKVPLDLWRRGAKWLLVVAILACLGLAVFSFAKVEALASCINGACRWYRLPLGLTFQPSELLKFGIMIFVAGFLALKTKLGEQKSLTKTLIPILLVLMLGLFFIVILQNDLGSGVALIGIVMCQLVIAKIPWKSVGVMGLILLAFGTGAIVIAPHRIERILSFGADCSTIDAKSRDWHICQALTSLGSGGLTGRGLGRSVQAFGWLPEAINDSLFAILGETFGFLGLMAILTIYFVLLYRVLKIADYIENVFLSIIVAGVFGWIATHIVVNVGAMTGVIPLTGITLPFLSFGGTSLLFIMSASGIVYNISRYTDHQKIDDKEGGNGESFSSRRRIGRTRDASNRSL